MKLRTLGIVLGVACLGLWGCEESGEVDEGAVPTEEIVDEAAGEEAGEEGADAGEEQEDAGPSAACNGILEAAQAGDTEKMAEFGASAEMGTSLKGASCGEATVAEDGATATVAVTAGDDTRDVPFKKDGDAWKFDTEAYMAKYPPAAKDDAVKGKKKKKKKKKRKKKRRKGR